MPSGSSSGRHIAGGSVGGTCTVCDTVGSRRADAVCGGSTCADTVSNACACNGSRGLVTLGDGPHKGSIDDGQEGRLYKRVSSVNLTRVFRKQKRDSPVNRVFTILVMVKVDTGGGGGSCPAGADEAAASWGTGICKDV